MRLIDADYFDKMLIDAQAECADKNNTFKYGFLSTVRANLDRCPSVDAEPVKRGKWLCHRVSRIGNTCIEHVQTEKCSVCKRYITTPFVYGRTVNNYCPHCGAKMDGGEKDG